MSTQKHSPDSTFPLSPRVKNAKTENTYQLPDTQSVVDMDAIPLANLQHFHQALIIDSPDMQDIDSTEKENEILDFVYHAVRPIYKKHLKDRNMVTWDQFKKNVDRGQIFEMLKKAAESPRDDKVLTTVILHDAFWMIPPVTDVERELAVFLESQNKAIEDSWNAKFIDESPLQGLVMYIEKQLVRGELYARYCSIVQSSGMGKSRLLDELSKKYFMIPINLRSKATTGFPPPDNDVRRFLTKSVNTLLRMQSFLIVLLEETTKTIGELGENITTRITKFREFMSRDQRMGSAGSDRVEFYGRVVERAGVLLSEPSSSESDTRLSTAVTNLRTALNAGTGSQDSHRIYARKPKDFVDVFIAFDEAHTLVNTIDKTSNQSHFVILRRRLSTIKLHPVFTFFLSTTGSITQFSQPHRQDTSKHINSGALLTPRPYIHLGFDQLMQSCRISIRYKTLDDVTSLECAAHMGRPLWGSRYDNGNDEVRQALVDFAKEKLLCEDNESLSRAQIYTILSQRLALDTNTTKYLVCSVNPYKAVQSMHEQIASHMRVCVAIEDGIETLCGIASSEPILSEAASRIMVSDKFSLPGALTTILGGCCINQGDRGELIVASFFTWARDQVVKNKPRPLEAPERQLCPYFSVTDLFRHLLTDSLYTSMLNDKLSICHPRVPPQLFGTVFQKATMHFNHLIKPQEQSTLASLYLLRFMARGAAALGANGQRGFDAVYPYLYDGIDLDVDKLGFIIVRVKNDSTNYTDKSLDKLFSKMDPFGCGLIDVNAKKNGQFPIPIIRIVFLLSGNGNFFKQHRSTSESKHAAREEPLFTSYDYVCVGIDKDILRATEEAPEKWEVLVNEQDGWNSFYNVDIPSIVRSELPASATHSGHYASWW